MNAETAVMERVFGMLRQDWVWDFCFDSTAAEPDMIRHAVTQNGVCTYKVDVSTLPTDKLPQQFGMGEHHRMLIMSSFTTGSITVGFAVSERIASSAPTTSREKYLGRLVRDDGNGCSIFIAEDYNDHITEVSYFQTAKTTTRENVSILFRTKPFLRAMRHLRDTKKLYVGLLRKSVVFFYYSTEARRCPTCGRDAKESCSCKLLIPRKMHSADMENEVKALQSYAGGFNGVASIGLFTKGRRVFQAAFPSYSNFQYLSDPGCRQRLGLWALHRSAGRRTVSPLSFCMGQGAMIGQGKVSPLDTFLLASIADSAFQDNACGNSKRAIACGSDSDGGPRSPCVEETEESVSDFQRGMASVYSGPPMRPQQTADANANSPPGFSSSAFVVPSSPAPSFGSIRSLLAPSTPTMSTASMPKSARRSEVQSTGDSGDAIIPAGEENVLVEPGPAVQKRVASFRWPAIQCRQGPAPAPAQVPAGTANLPLAASNEGRAGLPDAPSTVLQATATGPGCRSVPPLQVPLVKSYQTAPRAREKSHPLATALHAAPISRAPIPPAVGGPVLPPPSAPAVTRVPPLPASAVAPAVTTALGTQFVPDVAKRDAAMDVSDVSHGTAGELSGLSSTQERRCGATHIVPSCETRQARYILPHGAAVPPMAMRATGGIDKTCEEIDERRRKAELRKARNRESAQRSNQKRKMRIQALKDDIAAAASRELYLRAREKMLREENTSLRKGLVSK